MSLRCLRALVEEFSAATSWDGAPSAPLSVMPTQHRFWRNDKTMDASQLSRFGLTCAVLTEDLGEALLTWFRADSRVRTFQLLDLVQGLTANAPGFGRSSRESFAKYDPVSFSWRTAQLSLLGGLDEFSETWPRWGSMRNGESSVRPIQVPCIGESESGLWPTPTTPNGGRSLKHVDEWRGRSAYHKGKKVQVDLAQAVRLVSAGLWPTPTVCGNYNRKGASKTSGDGLATAVNQSVGSPGPLSPDWVEWLMGWPTGWTDLKPLEMGKFHEWQRQHSPCLLSREAA